MIRKKINLVVSKLLQKKLNERVGGLNMSDPVFDLGVWYEDDNPAPYWATSYRERTDIPVWDPVVIVDANGFELLIIQGEPICDLLEGKELTLVNSRLAVLDEKGEPYVPDLGALIKKTEEE